MIGRVLALTSDLIGKMGLWQALHLQEHTCLGGRELDCCAGVDTSVSLVGKYGREERVQEELAYSWKQMRKRWNHFIHNEIIMNIWLKCEYICEYITLKEMARCTYYLEREKLITTGWALVSTHIPSHAPANIQAHLLKHTHTHTHLMCFLWNVQ